ncbi:MAG: hypothetical protein Q9219_007071 [cf. Caloplaca sp. 3 TL-2023]
MLLVQTVIVVPVNMLWKVKISLRQKLALGGIFSITVVIMVFAIIRVVVVSNFSQTPDQTWLYMWSSVEQTVFACLASFRALFTKSKRPTPAHHGHRISDEEESDSEPKPSLTSSFASSRLFLLINKTFRMPSLFTRSSTSSPPPSSKASHNAAGGIGLRGVTHETSISAAKNPWQHHAEPSYGSGSSEEYILSSDRVHVKQEIDMA